MSESGYDLRKQLKPIVSLVRDQDAQMLNFVIGQHLKPTSRPANQEARRVLA